MGYIVCAVLPAARLSFLALFFFFVFGFCFLVCKILKLSANYFELLAELLVTSYLADTLLK